MYKKKIAILGSTGHIGEESLKIISKNKSQFSVEFLLCNRNFKKIIKQINQFNPKYVFVSDFIIFAKLKKKKLKKKTIFLNKIEDIVSLKNNLFFDISILATSGLSCFYINFLFVEISKKLLIANKETVICGNKLFINKCKKFKTDVFSLDSEHYCLNELLKKEKKININKYYITASGGPFFRKKFSYYKKAKINKTLVHPKWKMGKKISIDSATMVNKIFEVFEASILYDIKVDKINIKIHPDALVHSFVTLNNGLVKFIAHDTNMRIPISNNLMDKNYYFKNIFLNNDLINLSFFSPDPAKFKVLKLIPLINKYGHSGIIIFNILNDFLVYKYLDNKIFFYEIEKKLIKIFSLKIVKKFCVKKIKNINDIRKTFLFAENLCLKT